MLLTAEPANPHRRQLFIEIGPTMALKRIPNLRRQRSGAFHLLRRSQLIRLLTHSLARPERTNGQQPNLPYLSHQRSTRSESGNDAAHPPR